MIIYRLLISPLALVIALLIAPFHRKLRATLNLRIFQPDWPDWVGTAKTLWVHCASGEFEYAKPVIREWKKLNPQGKIFVSYFSPSFVKAIQSSPDVDGSRPLPLDLPGPMRQFIRKLKPSALAISRTDIWPEMCAQSRQLKVPIILFSSTHSKEVSPWLRLVTRWRLQLVDEIFVTTRDDESSLRNLSLRTPVVVTGDTRFDQVLYRLNHPKELRPDLPDSPKELILVAGSTWDEDEKILIEAAKDYCRQGQLRLIIAPHEPTESHLKELTSRLNQQNLAYSLYSQHSEWTAPVLIVDTMGILAELYLYGQVAFVGGSFRKSVHSVMEPLAAGALTFVGPHHQNNREALTFKSIALSPRFSMVCEVNSAGMFQQKLAEALEERANLPAWKLQIRNEISNRTGASPKIARHLTDLIEQRAVRAADQRDIPSMAPHP